MFKYHHIAGPVVVMFRLIACKKAFSFLNHTIGDDGLFAADSDDSRNPSISMLMNVGDIYIWTRFIVFRLVATLLHASLTVLVNVSLQKRFLITIWHFLVQ